MTFGANILSPRHQHHEIGHAPRVPVAGHRGVTTVVFPLPKTQWRRVLASSGFLRP